MELVCGRYLPGVGPSSMVGHKPSGALRHIVWQRRYLQCVLSLRGLGVQFVSGLSQSYYELLLRGRAPVDPTLSALECKRRLARLEGDEVRLAVLDCPPPPAKRARSSAASAATALPKNAVDGDSGDEWACGGDDAPPPPQQAATAFGELFFERRGVVVVVVRVRHRRRGSCRSQGVADGALWAAGAVRFWAL